MIRVVGDQIVIPEHGQPPNGARIMSIASSTPSDVTRMKRHEIAAEQQQVRLRIGEEPTRASNRRRMSPRTSVQIGREGNAKRRNRLVARVDRKQMTRQPEPPLQPERPREPRRPATDVREIVEVLEPSFPLAHSQRAPEPTRRLTHAVSGPSSIGRNVRRMKSRAGTRRMSSARKTGSGSYGAP